MKIKTTALVLLTWLAVSFSLVLPAAGSSAAGSSEKLHSPVISGFGDVLMSIRENDSGDVFSLGQVEIDIEENITPNVHACIAVANNGETVEISTMAIEWTVWQSITDESHDFPWLTRLILGGGKYDIPFGIDWKEYASVDRKVVSMPLVVEHTHSGWNDYGAYLSIQAEWGELTLFSADGTCCEEEGEEEGGRKIAVGGRLGWHPVEGMEVGCSLASEHCCIHGEIALKGLDFQYLSERLVVKGEYISRCVRTDYDVQSGTGFYLGGMYRWGKWFVVERYDSFDEGTTASRLSCGLGREIGEGLEGRFEYQLNIKNVPQVAYLQVVMSF